MAATQIAKVSIKHEAILDYLLVNPAEKLSNVAAYFGVGQPWLSVIIHSDAFQAKLAAKSGECFSSIVLPLREQLLGVAQVGVEKLGEALQNASTSSDKQFIADTTDSILKNLGYSPKSTSPTTISATTNNVFLIDKTALAAARAKMRTVPSGDLEEVQAIGSDEENGSIPEKI